MVVIKARAPGFRPRIAVVLGSGWGGLAERISNPVRIPYAELPGFPQATVAGHGGELWLGHIGGHAVAPTDSVVSYDKGTLDGKDLVAGQKDMWWNGTLVVNADKSFFAGSTTTPSNPTTTPTPTLSVNDISVTEPTGSKTSSGISGFLHTEGNQIVDAAGNNVRLTGVNWFGGEGYNYVPAGLWADSYQHHLENMKSVGFNTIRLTWSDEMFDSSAVTNGIDYSKNPDLAGLTRLQVYDKVIDYAGKLGMKVILDHHRNDGGAGTNESGLWYSDAHPESKMISNWKMLAQHYAGNTAVIGADLHNEPSVSATWGTGNQSTDWAAAAERIGNSIQTVNKDWLLFVEGTEWSSTLAGVKNTPIEFDTPNKLVYSPHVYAQSVGNFSWLSDPNYPKNLPAQYDGMWGYIYKNQTAPILIGEFGGQLTSSAEQTWASTLMKYTNGDWNLDGTSDLPTGDKGMSWTYWAWTPESGDVGGILMDDYKTINQTKVNIIKAGMAGSTFGDTTSTTPNTVDALFTVKLSAASTKAVTVDYSTVDGTAKAGSDYTATSGKLTFAAGETSKTVAVKVLSDSVTEGTETFSLKLANPTTATIADATGNASITEGAAKAAAAAAAAVDVWANTVTTASTAANDTATTTAAHDAVTASVDTASLAHVATDTAYHGTEWYDPSLLHNAA